MLFIFLMPALIRHLLQLKKVVFLHWCLICVVILNQEREILSNCDIEFYNFRHLKVQKCKILNQSKWDQNFEVNFQNHQKRKQKLSKYNKIEQYQIIILWKFVRCHWISWNLSNLIIFVLFWKSPKDLCLMKLNQYKEIIFRKF